MIDETPGSAMLDAVRQFATELAALRHEESDAREAMRKEVSEQMTAVRHDVYGSVAYLSQQSVEMKTTIEQQRKDSFEWRSTERTAREVGQQGYRILVFTSLVLSTTALVVSLSVAVTLILKVF